MNENKSKRKYKLWRRKNLFCSSKSSNWFDLNKKQIKRTNQSPKIFGSTYHTVQNERDIDIKYEQFKI